jgi:hypothetical protein
MPIHKITLFWEVPSAGFSESWYLDSESPLLALEMIQLWLPFRLKLAASGGATGQPARIITVRAQEVGTKNIRLLVGDFKGTFAPTQADSVDMPWTGALVRITDNNNNFRMLTMRGVPDEVIEDGYKLPIARNAWLKALQDLLKATQNSPFRLRSNDKAAGGGAHDISAITANANGLLVTTALPHGLATNDYIVFYQCKAAIKLQGKHRIRRESDTTFQVFGYNVQTVGFQFGQYFEFTPEYSAISDIQYVRKASRKAGRPFFLLRGRR